MPRLPQPVLDRLPERFARHERQAEQLAQDGEAVESLVRRSAQKLRRHRRQIGQLAASLPVLLRLARAWSAGEYRRIRWRSAVLVVAALLYFLNPFDLIPDYLPVIGYLDDALVIGYVMNALRGEVRHFERWERRRGRRR